MSFDDKLRNSESEKLSHTNVNESENNPIRNLVLIGEKKSKEDIEKEKIKRQHKLFIKSLKTSFIDVNEYLSQLVLEELWKKYNSPQANKEDKCSIENLVIENYEHYIAKYCHYALWQHNLNYQDIEDLSSELRLYILDKWRCYDIDRKVPFMGFIRRGCWGLVQNFIKRNNKFKCRFTLSLDPLDADDYIDPIDIEETVTIRFLLQDSCEKLSKLEFFVLQRKVAGWTHEIIAEDVVAAGFKKKYNKSQVSKLLKEIKNKYEE